MFQGDQGIDALAARRLVLEHSWPLEGPATSAGGVHLGPLYYYLLALPMAVGGFDPLLEAVLMVALGSLAVGLLYWISKSWFGPWVAAIAAGLYAISPAAIVASRSAWNPAPAPFFLLLALLGLARAHQTQRGRWLVLTGFGAGCLIQFHYFTLGVIAVCLIAVGLQLKRHRGSVLLSVAVFVALLAPFIWHELQNGLPNIQAAGNLAATSQPSPDSMPRRLYAVLALGLVGGFLTAGVEPLAAIAALAIGTGLVLGLITQRSYPYVLIAALLGVTLLQVVGYRGPIFEHYFVPLAPLLYLAVAAAATAVPVRVAGALALGLGALNLANSPLREEPLFHLARAENVASAIAARANDEPYALWLFAQGDADGAYRYQLDRLGRPPARPDAPLPRRLFILCQQEPCDIMRRQSAVGPDWATAYLVWQANFYRVSILELER
ncbi:MAG TPA: glycosyltransferase family 39 protein [Chloroflexota bacterium]